MHQPIRERLEQYLGGTEDRDVELHLAECRQCKSEVERMRRQAAILRSLRPGELEPAPGFYARVMERVESQRITSVWSILLEPVFAKRLAYASLALLALLGTLAVSIGTEPAAPPSSAEVIMVENPIGPPLGADPARDRNVVLVNLATYQH
jgi:anti-sigma factor RsiW